MGEFFKDVFEAITTRLRTPFLGSVLLVFVVVNWRELMFLLFADNSVQYRIAYFDLNTDSWSLYFWPLFVGIPAALLLPYLKWFGALVAKRPAHLYWELKEVAEIEKRTKTLELQALELQAKADFEERSERRILDAARRAREAEKIGPDTTKELLEGRSRSQSSSGSSTGFSHGINSNVLNSSLDDFSNSLAANEKILKALFFARVHGEGAFWLNDQDLVSGQEPRVLNMPIMKNFLEDAREKTRFRTKLVEFIDNGYLRVRSPNVYELTEQAFRLLDNLPSTDI